MKTTLLTMLLTCTASAVFAQGVVQFRNLYSSGPVNIDARVSMAHWNGDPFALLDNSNPLWRATLLGGPTTATPANVPTCYPGAGGQLQMGTLTQLYNPVNTTISWVNFRAAPNNGSVTVANASRVITDVNWGGQALVQMVVWQGNYNTWSEAFNAWLADMTGTVHIGASNPLTLTLPTGPTDPNLTYLVGLQPFPIFPVPEPTTFALAGLGAAALLIFRHRKVRPSR